MIYNAAKVLLALALMVLRLAKRQVGSNLLGTLSVAVGAIAFLANAASLAAGRDVFGELPLAGASGVVATVILGVALFSVSDSESSL